MCNSAGVQGGTNRSATNIRDKEKNQEKEEGGGGGTIRRQCSMSSSNTTNWIES